MENFYKKVLKSLVIITSVTGIGVSGILNSSAQDIHFSQMSYSPLTLNPALAGANFDMQAIANYRSQWKSVAAVPYKTMAGSFDMRIKKKKNAAGFFAVGINFFNDQAGDVLMKTNNGALSLAYHLHLDANSTLGGGLTGGFGQRSINPASGEWASQYNGFQYDGSLQSGESFASDGFIYFDAGTGVVYSYKKSERYMTGNDQLWINAGIAAHHINKPKYSFINAADEKLNMRLSGFANGLVGLGSTPFSAVPGIYYNRQGAAQEILMGSYIKYMLKEESKYTGLINASAISAGVFYRNKDAVILKGLFEWSSYAMGFAYDLNTSSLSEVSKRKGGFEIFIRFVSPSPFSVSKARI